MRRAATAGALAVVGLLTGCGVLRDAGVPAGSDDRYEVTVHLANAVNLVPHAEVKVDDVTVGSVESIDLVDWHAVATIALDRSVQLPANAVARIGQKSLLGAEYLELDAPEGGRAVGRLEDGDEIPLERTGRYPETEEVLSAVSVMVNGGGLTHLGTITRELNAAFHGREDSVRSVLTQLDTFFGTLDHQRAGILRALRGLDRLGGTMARQRDVLDRALQTMPEAVETVARDRQALVGMLQELADLDGVVGRVSRTSRDDLVAWLHDVRPVLRELADAGTHLPGSLGNLTFPYPVDAVPKALRGDYVNIITTVDLTLPTLTRDWLTGTPLDGVYTGLLGGSPQGPASESSDPRTAPLDLLPDLSLVPDGLRDQQSPGGPSTLVPRLDGGDGR